MHATNIIREIKVITRQKNDKVIVLAIVIAIAIATVVISTHLSSIRRIGQTLRVSNHTSGEHNFSIDWLLGSK